MKSMLNTLACALLVLAAGMVHAENSTQAGGYTIHHNALTTDNLPVQVATAYRIQRSPNRGMLNVSVIRNEAGTTGVPVHADIRAVARTLYGQIRPITFREIVEGKAIYYIAEFPVSHRDFLTFDFEIMPEDGRFPLRATMQQEFFTQ